VNVHQATAVADASPRRYSDGRNRLVVATSNCTVSHRLSDMFHHANVGAASHYPRIYQVTRTFIIYRVHYNVNGQITQSPFVCLPVGVSVRKQRNAKACILTMHTF